MVAFVLLHMVRCDFYVILCMEIYLFLFLIFKNEWLETEVFQIPDSCNLTMIELIMHRAHKQI